MVNIEMGIIIITLVFHILSTGLQLIIIRLVRRHHSFIFAFSNLIRSQLIEFSITCIQRIGNYSFVPWVVP